jgi:hypothetical protein
LILPGTSASLGPPIPPAESPLVLGNFVDEAKFLGTELRHPAYESSTDSLVSLLSDPLKPFATDSGTNEFSVDGSEVDRNESVGLEEIEKFVEKEVRISLHKLQQILHVVTFEAARVPDDQAGCLVGNHVAGRPPELEHAVERAFGHVAAKEDVVEWDKIAFEESDCCDFDIAADGTIHHRIETWI